MLRGKRNENPYAQATKVDLCELKETGRQREKETELEREENIQ